MVAQSHPVWATSLQFRTSLSHHPKGFRHNVSLKEYLPQNLHFCVWSFSATQLSLPTTLATQQTLKQKYYTPEPYYQEGTKVTLRRVEVIVTWKLMVWERTRELCSLSALTEKYNRLLHVNTTFWHWMQGSTIWKYVGLNIIFWNFQHSLISTVLLHLREAALSLQVLGKRGYNRM